jgi:transketolase
LKNFDQIEELEEFARKMRRVILEVSLNCGEPAHIGGGLSITDIMAVLYGKILKLNKKEPKDRFILSKGHGFLGLLSALHLSGFIKKEELMKFQTNGSELIAHPIVNPKFGIESSNGSLGQGLSFGVGLAIAYKKKKKEDKIFVLVGDGECYEGAIWEAAIAATESNLDNLTVIVDCNGFQNDGAINKKMNFDELKSKWQGFGWNTILCDGHNIDELIEKLQNKKIDKPTAIIAKTIKGKGIKFMENNNDWHHGRLTQKLFDEAIKDL